MPQKSRFGVGAALLLGSAALAAAVLPLTPLVQRTPQRVYRPVSNDSVDTRGKRFDEAAILSQKMNFQWAPEMTGSIAMDADSMYVFARPDSGAVVYAVQTCLRPDAFAKGKLEVASPVPFEIYVDDTSVGVKTDTQDSISAASWKRVPLTMNPEVTYRITVKALVSAGRKGDKVPMRLQYAPDPASASVTVAQGPSVKNRFQLANTDQGERVAAFSLSPDGQYGIVSYRNRFKDQSVTARYELLHTKTGKVVSRGRETVRWMPRGSKLYYTAKTDHGYNLYVMDARTLEPSLWAENLPNNDFMWSPTEDYIIYQAVQEEDKTVTGKPLRRYASPDDRIVGNRRRTTLNRYDIDSGSEQVLTFGTQSTHPLDISADGRRLLFMTVRETPAKYPFYSNTLVQLDMTSMRADTIIADNGYISGAIYSPDAEQLFITGSPRTFGGAGVNIGTLPIPNDFDTQGYIYTLRNGDVRAVTREFNPSLVGSPVWNAADGQVYFMANDGFYRRLYSLDPANGRITQLPVEVQMVGSFSIGDHEKDYLAYTAQGNTYTGRAYLLNLRNKRNTCVADPMGPVIDGIELGSTTPWTFTSSDGTLIDGTVTLPPGFDPNKKYPLLVYYYGGTSPSQHALNHPYVPQLYAAQDYVVYVLNPSGTYGYGQEFSARHVNAWGKRTAEDIIEGVKQFVAEHPYVDSKKIGCFGASYGGFMTQYLLTRTDIFAAAMSHAGISDLTSYWGEGYWGYTYNSVAAAESYPWTNPELFTKQGSLFNADKIHTPLLLIHGTVDTNVPIGESIQIFNALRILGRDVEFISVDGGNHTSGSFPMEKRQLWYNTVMAWFAKYLKDDPRWWNEMYPPEHL